MIIGTAGHIDHGKSALVEALTGRSVDRLAEERRRGITIDLNFAPLALADGTVAGVIDVPGHEDLVRTMIAGASGMHLVLLVVAADAGIQPQTLEHLAVVESLGVRDGIAVLTKSDLVDRSTLEVRLGELRERLGASPVRFGEAAVVSARTGEGIAALRERLAACRRPAAAPDAFRLPIDRCFSVAGVGTVVTGTAWSGTLAVGDAVRLLPSGAEGRVRSIEMYGASANASIPGARVALGLAGVDRDAIGRGEWVVTADLPWRPTSALDVAVDLQPAASTPLASRTRVRVHLGTAEVMARVVTATPVEPGGSGEVRLTLESPVLARGGDRVVLRAFSPVGTLGGGRVLDPAPPSRSRAADLRGAVAGDQLLAALVRRRLDGLPLAEVPIVGGVAPVAVERAAKGLAGIRRVGGHLVAGDRLLGLQRSLGVAVEAR
ncbi:MAG TPA: selenocysteine-specific translation elongation factor, partial [Gemmatimonadales bacterium]|nr:selenocysteine-specific translation elongation factor [Gemmatimonadales bacterium]